MKSRRRRKKFDFSGEIRQFFRRMNADPAFSFFLFMRHILCYNGLITVVGSCFPEDGRLVPCGRALRFPAEDALRLRPGIGGKEI